MQQYFIDQHLALNEQVKLNKDIQFHLKNVLKSKPHTTIRLVDFHGNGFFAQVDQNIENALLTKPITKKSDIATDITLIMSLIKKEKLELVIAKATELGVSKIILLHASRCVVSFSKKEMEKKLLRFATIAQEAAETSHRLTLPKIIGPLTIPQLKDIHSDHKILLYENTDQSVQLPKMKHQQSVSVIVGPEGGFTQEEVAHFELLGFQQASLTHRVLRSETAAMMAMTLLGGYYD